MSFLFIKAPIPYFYDVSVPHCPCSSWILNSFFPSLEYHTPMLNLRRWIKGKVFVSPKINAVVLVLPYLLFALLELYVLLFPTWEE